ncbi:TetR/AcrR family transcriptional regulator [Actinoplanes sp. NEAU-A12]|uniref:TetR/AcrR family transcriptional regulator n=1 Tax=Actinoplanes sandaracinus TaxID=3045177 RepID=A0ABT6X1Y9_9ACTN|nr:TetR/AcrR family transcriptional regulator [Actinoplanes sandaracinus]MDI6106021.1 TetR/AcrR family transcriptional regulator [Actinoplanes sandaracinus]
MTEPIPAPPWQTPKKPPPRQPLSQDLIVQVALRILDAEGLDALSMRRLAQELETGPASLYAHVANKDELLDLVYDTVLSEVEIPVPDPDRWPEQVKEYLRSLRTVFRSHRDLARVSISRIPLGPNGVVGMERTMALMRAGGLPDDIAAYAGDLLASFVTTETLDDAFPAGGTDPATPRAYAAQIRSYLTSLPVDRFPNLVHMAGPITSLDSERRFELGMEIIVRGLSTYARPAGQDSSAGSG